MGAPQMNVEALENFLDGSDMIDDISWDNFDPPDAAAPDLLTDFEPCDLLDEIRDKMLEEEHERHERKNRRSLSKQYSPKYFYLQALREKRPVPTEILNMVVKRGFLDDVTSLRCVAKPLATCRPPPEKQRSVSFASESDLEEVMEFDKDRRIHHPEAADLDDLFLKAMSNKFMLFLSILVFLAMSIAWIKIAIWGHLQSHSFSNYANTESHLEEISRSLLLNMTPLDIGLGIGVGAASKMHSWQSL